MVVVLEMVMTVSPLLTSAPSVRVQVVTMPSMGAVALKLLSAFWASVSFSMASSISFCLARMSESMVSEPITSRTSPAFTLAYRSRLSVSRGPSDSVTIFRVS